MKQHELLREYVRVLLSTNATSLVVKGNGGIGKSHTVMEELSEMGLEEGIQYFYISGHVTPLELFNTINRSSTLEPPQLLVFDDIDSLVSNKTSVALLKSALGEIRGKRIVSYKSTSSKVEGSGTVDFEGKVLLILNDIKHENAFGKPLLDRCIVFDMSLSQKELIEYIDSILPVMTTKLPLEVRKEIWAKIKPFSDNPKFSVRALVRAFEFYEYDKDKLMPLFINGLKLTDDQKIYYEVQRTDKKNKAKEFVNQSGANIRTYYKIKKDLRK